MADEGEKIVEEAAGHLKGGEEEYGCCKWGLYLFVKFGRHWPNDVLFLCPLFWVTIPVYILYMDLMKISFFHLPYVLSNLLYIDCIKNMRTRTSIWLNANVFFLLHCIVMT